MVVEPLLQPPLKSNTGGLKKWVVLSEYSTVKRSVQKFRLCVILTDNYGHHHCGLNNLFIWLRKTTGIFHSSAKAYVGVSQMLFRSDL